MHFTRRSEQRVEERDLCFIVSAKELSAGDHLVCNTELRSMRSPTTYKIDLRCPAPVSNKRASLAPPTASANEQARGSFVPTQSVLTRISAIAGSIVVIAIASKDLINSYHEA
jgi:hypothetical protein